MSIDIAAILKGASLTNSVVKYVGLIEDKLELKLNLIVGSELEAGLRALQQAINSEREKTSLLREARGRFNIAVSLEKGLRLALAYLGLALCHSFLEDRENAKSALRKIISVKPLPSPMALMGGILATEPGPLAAIKIFGVWASESFKGKGGENEIDSAKLKRLQQSVIDYLR